MKKTTIIFIIPCLILLLTGCIKKDNYAAPDSAIQGHLVDGEKGGSLELKQPGGGTIRLVEWNPAKYPSPTPIDLSVKADGSYSSSQLFADTYKTFPMNGPFQYLPADSVTVTLPHNGVTQLDFKVVPFYYITSTVTDSTFSYTVTKSATNTGNLNGIIFMINNFSIVNEDISSNQNGSYYTNLWKIDASDAMLGTPQTFTFNFADTKLPKGDYYFRVGAVGSSSSSYYNYSPVIKATVH
jgi:hypothetical protein